MKCRTPRAARIRAKNNRQRQLNIWKHLTHLILFLLTPITPIIPIRNKNVPAPNITYNKVLLNL